MVSTEESAQVGVAVKGPRSVSGTVPPSYTTDHLRHVLDRLICDKFLVNQRLPGYGRQLHGSAGQPTKIGHWQHDVPCNINNRHAGRRHPRADTDDLTPGGVGVNLVQPPANGNLCP